MISSAVEIYAAEDRCREIVRQTGGWTGAAIGAWAGGKLGAAGGAALGSMCGVIGAGPGGIAGGLFGAFGGGIAGWEGGTTITEIVYEKWFTPIEKEEYIISCYQDEKNAGAEFQ